MTHDLEIERVLDQWFGAGPSEVPDRVLDAVADRIEHQPQRPAWRLHWRQPHVTSTVRLTASAAALFIAIVGVAMLGRIAAPSAGGGTAGGIPVASVAPTPSTPAATPSPSQTPIAQRAVNAMGVSYSPASGWQSAMDTKDEFLLTIPGTAVDWGEGLWIFMNPVVSEDVACSTVPASGIGHGIDQLVQGIRARPGLRTSSPVPIGIGGLAGVSLDVTLDPTWSHVCPGDNWASVTYLTQDRARPAATWSTAGLEHQRIALLDDGAGGVILVALNVLATDDVRLDMVARQAAPIIDSLSFPESAGASSGGASNQP